MSAYTIEGEVYYVTQERDPCASLTSLSLFNPDGHNSFVDWDIDSSRGCSAWVVEQEVIADMEPLKIQVVDRIHEVTLGVD